MPAARAKLLVALVGVIASTGCAASAPASPSPTAGDARAATSTTLPSATVGLRRRVPRGLVRVAGAWRGRRLPPRPRREDPRRQRRRLRRQLEAGDLAEAVGRANDAGWQVSAHAVSTEAVEALLDAFEAAIGPTGPNPLHHRIEHAIQVSDDQLAMQARS